MSTRVRFYRVNVLPDVCETDAVYFVRGPGTLDIWVTNSEGEPTLSFNRARVLEALAGGVEPGFVFQQATPSARWTIAHNLGLLPAVHTLNTGGKTIVGDVTYLTDNVLTIDFLVPVAGRARLT